MKHIGILHFLFTVLAALMSVCAASYAGASESPVEQSLRIASENFKNRQKISDARIRFWSEEFPEHRKRASEMMRGAPAGSLCLAIVKISGKEKRLFTAFYHGGKWKWLTPDSPYEISGNIKRGIDTMASPFVDFDFSLRETESCGAWDFSCGRIGVPPKGSFLFRSECIAREEGGVGRTYEVRNRFCIFSPDDSAEWTVDGVGKLAAGASFSMDSVFESCSERHAYESPREIAAKHILLVLDTKALVKNARAKLSQYPKHTLFAGVISAVNGGGTMKMAVPLGESMEGAKSDDGKTVMSGTCLRTDLGDKYSVKLDMRIEDSDGGRLECAPLVNIPKGEDFMSEAAGISCSAGSTGPIRGTQLILCLFTAGDGE